jgi:hypothetical protein
MTAAIARIFPRATAASVANIDAFITVALFSGLGLLLSLPGFYSVTAISVRHQLSGVC